MIKRELSDKNKNIISMFAIVCVAVLLFIYLFFSTNLFNFDAEGMARIQKLDKGLDVKIPNVIIEGEEDVKVKKGDIVIPSISVNPFDLIDYDFIAHPLYPDFAEPHNTYINNGLLSISDVIIYNTGYYSINGNPWTPYTLQGNPYSSGSPWLLDSATYSLPSVFDTEGTHYILVYSCSLVNNAWDCHKNIYNQDMWQLNIVDGASNNNDPVCGDGDCNSGETPSNCPDDCGNVDSNLFAGMAKVDITPSPGRNLVGYGNAAPSTGVNDPLHARVLVLEENGVTIAFVSIDILMFSSDRVINQAKQQFDVDHVILSVSHTHAGPSLEPMSTWMTAGDDGPYPDDSLYTEMEDKIITAIGEASNNLFSASISAGKGTLDDAYYFDHNVRKVYANGTVVEWWENLDKVETYPVDHTVGVVRIDDSSGNTRAMIVNYAAHPQHTEVWNTIISADYPGAMSSYIENQLGPGSVALFIQGAGGDISPYYAGSPGSDPFENIEGAGAELAQAALNVPTVKTNGGSIEVENTIMEFDYRWYGSETLEAGLTTIVIDDAMAFVVAPGEFFVQHQINLRAGSPLPNTFLFGYSYSGIGEHFMLYLPTRQAAAEGGYGADEVTYFAVGTGEAMIDKALEIINGFLN